MTQQIDAHKTPHASSNTCSLSVVVPCYNEEESIDELYQRVSTVCKQTAGTDYEIVLVNDGSSDTTLDHIRRFSDDDAHVVGVALSRNHGHQLALSAGLSICVGQRVLILDADLQDPPELLPDMIDLMDQGADVVYGQRVARKGETATKRTTAYLFYRILDWITDIEIPVDTGDFRLMSRRSLDALISMPERQRFIRGMVSWIGFKQVPIEYERHERFAGITKYPMAKMVRFAIDAITSFSIQPLRIATYFGFTFGLLGILGLVYVLLSWFLGQTVPGWTSVTVILLVLGSVQLFVIGILGEYLGRLYLENKRRPLFLIAEVIRQMEDAENHTDVSTGSGS